MSALLFQKLYFRLRSSYDIRPHVRRLWWGFQGAYFGKGTKVPKLHIVWPHQVHIGNDCILENDITFKFDGIWQPGPQIVLGNRVFLGQGCEFNIRQCIHIGDDCLIASGCKFIDHDHGIYLGETMNRQVGKEAEIFLEEDVWLGVNVVVLKGVRISKGAVIGSGAVVTKSVGANEIWAGIPAKKIGVRVQRPFER